LIGTEIVSQPERHSVERTSPYVRDKNNPRWSGAWFGSQSGNWIRSRSLLSLLHDHKSYPSIKFYQKIPKSVIQAIKWYGSILICDKKYDPIGAGTVWDVWAHTDFVIGKQSSDYTFRLKHFDRLKQPALT